MDITIGLAVAALLLCGNAFFVATEFALVKADGFRIQALADQGSASARLTVRIQQHLEDYLMACQFGITLASLGLGWVAASTLAALLEPVQSRADLSQQTVYAIAFIGVFLSFSSLHMVTGALLPKTLAIRRSEAVSLAIAYPLHWFYLGVYPLTWLLNGASRVMLRCLSVPEAPHAGVLTGEVPEGLATTSHEHPETEHVQADTLQKLFEFDRREVGAVMVPVSSVEALDIRATSADNLKTIRETGYSRFPLIDGGDRGAIKGVVLAKDIYAAMLHGEQKPWADLAQLSREPLIVPASQRVEEVFERMCSKRANMAIVVNGYGRLAGIVTLADLLEEIVGEIHDESEKAGPLSQ